MSRQPAYGRERLVTAVRAARPVPRQSLVWRVFAANAVVLVASVTLLATLPITVSWPVSLGEGLVLAGGLLVMLIANLLLVRRVLTPVGRLRHVMLTLDPLQPSGPIDVGARSVEVAQLTAAFNEMIERLQRERRESAQRTQAAQEDERRALSLELHDEVGQSLTALLLQLDVASRTASPEQQQALSASVDAVRDCLERVRSIVRRLRPQILDELGLVSAVAHLCDRMAQEGGLAIERRLDRELPSLAPDAQLVVYRVTQEGLTNIVRHAGATHAEVELRRHGGNVRLRVSDDGVGLGVSSRDGTGIRGMRERALLIGASLQITGGAAGTVLVLDVPATEVRE